MSDETDLLKLADKGQYDELTQALASWDKSLSPNVAKKLLWHRVLIWQALQKIAKTKTKSKINSHLPAKVTELDDFITRKNNAKSEISAPDKQMQNTVVASLQTNQVTTSVTNTQAQVTNPPLQILATQETKSSSALQEKPNAVKSNESIIAVEKEELFGYMMADILRLIFAFIPINQLPNSAIVNRHWHRIAQPLIPDIQQLYPAYPAPFSEGNYGEFVKITEFKRAVIQQLHLQSIEEKNLFGRLLLQPSSEEKNLLTRLFYQLSKKSLECFQAIYEADTEEGLEKVVNLIARGNLSYFIDENETLDINVGREGGISPLYCAIYLNRQAALDWIFMRLRPTFQRYNRIVLYGANGGNIVDIHINSTGGRFINTTEFEIAILLNQTQYIKEYITTNPDFLANSILMQMYRIAMIIMYFNRNEILTIIIENLREKLVDLQRCYLHKMLEAAIECRRPALAQLVIAVDYIDPKRWINACHLKKAISYHAENTILCMLEAHPAVAAMGTEVIQNITETIHGSESTLHSK